MPSVSRKPRQKAIWENVGATLPFFLFSLDDAVATTISATAPSTATPQPPTSTPSTTDSKFIQPATQRPRVTIKQGSATKITIKQSSTPEQ
jgi:hypothetical protein